MGNDILVREIELIQRRKKHEEKVISDASQEEGNRLKRVAKKYEECYGKKPTKQQLNDMLEFLDRCNKKLLLR